MSEQQATRAGHNVEVVRVDLETNDRARAVGEPTGFVELVVDADSKDGDLLGATVIAAEAGELVHAFVMLMHLKRPLASLLDAIFIHPTRFEAIHQAVDAWHKQRRS